MKIKFFHSFDEEILKCLECDDVESKFLKGSIPILKPRILVSRLKCDCEIRVAGEGEGLGDEILILRFFDHHTNHKKLQSRNFEKRFLESFRRYYVDISVYENLVVHIA